MVDDNIDEIPSLEGAAKQINTLKQHHGLKKVFLATDASLSGINYVLYYCFKVIFPLFRTRDVCQVGRGCGLVHTI